MPPTTVIHDQGASPLLRLPCELRDMIYEELFADEPSQPQLLRVCVRMHQDVVRFVYRRAVRFDTYSDFFSWVTRCFEREPRVVYLRHVRGVKLRVGRGDAKACVEMGDRCLPLEELMATFAERILERFSRVPDIREIALSFSGSDGPDEKKVEVMWFERICRQLILRYPKLRSLDLTASSVSIGLLGEAKNLEHFRLKGGIDWRNMTGPPCERVIPDFARPLHLTSLELSGTPTTKAPEDSVNIASVLDYIPPLTRLYLTDLWRDDIPSEIFPALNRHKQSLRDFGISLLQRMPRDTQSALVRFYMGTQLRRLALRCVPHNHVEIFLFLPETLEELQLRAEHGNKLWRAIPALVERRGARGQLRRLRRFLVTDTVSIVPPLAHFVPGERHFYESLAAVGIELRTRLQPYTTDDLALADALERIMGD